MINPTKCSAVIVGNIIAGSDDHGIVLRGRCFPVLMNNVIYDCSSAGIAVENACDALLVNNTIVNCGRGLRLFDLGRWGPPYSLTPGGGTATVVNCIIWDCAEPITLADSSNMDIDDRGSHLTVMYSDIDGGEAGVSVSGSQSTSVWGVGNIDTDPLFADIEQGDLHLQSEFGRWDPNEQSWVLDDATSPCLDAGDLNDPTGDEPTPHGDRINLGAYGGTTEASKSPNRAPVFDPIPEPFAERGGPLTVTVSATDPDGDALTYEAQDLPAGATFIGQTFSWPAADAQSGTYEVTFVVTDGALQDSVTLTLTMRAANAIPSLAPRTPGT